MRSLWKFVGSDANRQILSWIGGGLVALAVGLWAVVTYVWPVHGPPDPGCAQQSVVVGGGVSGSTITNNANGATISVPCIGAKK